MRASIDELARELGRVLQQRGLMLATAESCTGGWLGKMITDVDGSSHWFERGFITYSNQAKQELLGVSHETLERFGAVSEQTAREMAEGALSNSPAQVSVAITGIAGPEGGSDEKPVGTVWLAWSAQESPTRCMLMQFSGDREAIRHQAVVAASQGLLDILRAPP